MIISIIIYIIAFISLILLGIVAYNMQKNRNNHNISFDTSLKLTNMPIVCFKHGRRKINFLIDTGSDFSYIDESIVKHLKIKKKVGTDGNVITASGYLKTSGNIIIDLVHNKHKVEGEFTVGDIKDAMDSAFAPEIIVRGILGSIFLKKYKYIIDYNKNELKYKKRKSDTKTNSTE